MLGFHEDQFIGEVIEEESEIGELRIPYHCRLYSGGDFR
jgi:hypothetical protein